MTASGEFWATVDTTGRSPGPAGWGWARCRGACGLLGQDAAPKRRVGPPAGGRRDPRAAPGRGAERLALPQPVREPEQFARAFLESAENPLRVVDRVVYRRRARLSTQGRPAGHAAGSPTRRPVQII